MRLGCWGAFFWLVGMSAVIASAQAPADAREALEEVLERLHQSSRGKPLLERAVRLWKLGTYRDLTGVIVLGTQSKTDSVLTRHFDPGTGKETRERSVHVLIKAAQPREDVLLDLAHELVHATSRAEWDPYDPELTPVRYITSSIEGPGGEVEAVVAECEVALEIYGQAETAQKRCGHYRTQAPGSLSRDEIRKDFYRVGKWYADIRKKTGSDAPSLQYLSPDRPRLFSSTGGAPYPVSLFREYQELTAIACENSRQRAVATGRAAGSNGAGRRPAAISDANLFLAQRCSR